MMMAQFIGDVCLGMLLAPFFIGVLLFIKLVIKDLLGIKPPTTGV
jgi:hypothetical protein